ncbi:MAG: hypothetical protein H6918_12810 [Sphingomonadaceae bacterium]|nr:hypothetical protein [Sphingomonadaceae bacterium]
MLFGLVFLVALIAGLAIGAAFVLEAITPQTRWKLRAVWAGLFAGFLPITVPLAALVSETGFSSEGIIAILAVLVGGAMFAVLLGFPAAYFFLRAREAKRGAGQPSDAFE